MFQVTRLGAWLPDERAPTNTIVCVRVHDLAEILTPSLFRLNTQTHDLITTTASSSKYLKPSIEDTNTRAP